MKKKFRFTNVKNLVVLMMIFMAVVITAANLISTKIEFGGNTETILQDYMSDMASSGGMLADNLYLEYDGEIPADVYAQYFSEMSIEELSSSYAYVVDLNTTTMLFHPDSSKIGNPVANSVILGLCEDVQNGKSFKTEDYVEYVFKGETKMAAYSVVADNNLVVVISADKSDVTGRVNSILMTSLISSIICMIIVIIIMVIILQIIFSDLDKVRGVVEQLSRFELTDDEAETARLCRKKSEIGDIARAVRDLRSGLRDTVSALKDNSSMLAAYSNNLTENSESVSDFMNSIDRACNDIAEGATNQAHSTEDATHSVVDIGELIDVSTSAVDELKSVSHVVKEATYSADDKLASVRDTNRKVTEATERIRLSISETSKSAESIRNAAEIITGIASQTNLLSLNASIEAARAGEAGRGFAVVASEISQLSEQSNQAASQIGEIIKELIENSNRSVEDIKKAKDITEEQTDKLQEAINEFHRVKEGMDKSFVEIDKVKASTIELNKSKNNILDMIQSLAAISEENAASTEETASSVSQAKNVIEEVAGKANEVSGVAMQMETDANKWVL